MRKSFFLGSGAAARYCVYTPANGLCRGAWLYVAPFTEEMNKSRRMAMLQAQRLSAAGYAVLQLDAYGTGDSAGDFADARWHIWLEDLARGVQWLQQQGAQPVGLWGLRLGVLLALDYARQAPMPPAALLCWQPVLQGHHFLTQFLRLKLAGALMQQQQHQLTTSALRTTLAAGQPLEIGGYLLSSELALAIDAADASLCAPACPVRWLEVSATPTQVLSPAAQKQIQAWRAQGVEVSAQVAAGVPFWGTQEISTNPALLDATIHILTAACHV